MAYSFWTIVPGHVADDVEKHLDSIDIGQRSLIERQTQIDGFVEMHIHYLSRTGDGAALVEMLNDDERGLVSIQMMIQGHRVHLHKLELARPMVNSRRTRKR